MPYPNDHYIVETDWLAANLDDPSLRILDCGVDVELGDDGSWVFSPARDTWRSGHVPGATFVDFLADASDRASSLPFMLPPADEFGEAMRRHGVGQGTRVIVYDKLANNWSARLWWMLRAYGFTTAAVLNGGLVKWQLEGRPRSTDEVTPPAGDFEPRTRRSAQNVFVGRDRVLAAMEDRGTCLIDALDADHYPRDPATSPPPSTSRGWTSWTWRRTPICRRRSWSRCWGVSGSARVTRFSRTAARESAPARSRSPWP